MKTPKEKAEELVMTFLRLQSNWFHKKLAKKCALIAVDEILNTTLVSPPKKYWQSVKTEIEKL